MLYTFKTVDEIREAAYEMADRYHTEYIMPKETDGNPMLAMGLNYVRFGHEERNLFRFLFQTDKFGGKDIGALMSDPGLSEVLEVMASGLKVGTEQAREMFLTFFCVAHGLGHGSDERRVRLWKYLVAACNARIYRRDHRIC